ncbi:DedA family protein [Nocardioides sp. SLBN-35]|uniref:DedA family protein n=1 Tax=Nocardioides sp. SLBN-35 TaxID=2768445 RepID=UPI001152CFA1|nr:DedA family protein [Nocardioides sp. SLBN-35]TQK73293.1 membrane protein DedA with SNARE-associated domain [Nocardioides sp. SLBN-35]
MTALVEHLLAVPAWLAVVVVFLLPALESSVFLGFVFPGELALLLGGVVAGQGHVPVAVVAAAGIAGAAAGDTVGYLVGKRWGRRILDSTVGRFVRADRLDRAEHALSRRGGWAVLVGRFTVALRVLVPGLAGMGRMPYRRFLLANLTGAVLWGGMMVAAGYLAGSSWQHVAHQLSNAGLVLTGVVLAFLVGRHVLARHRRGRMSTTVEP